MARWFSIASDGVVRAHSKLENAARKIRRGGKIQLGGKAGWMSYEEASALLLRIKKSDAEARERQAAFSKAQHEAGKHGDHSWVSGCPLCPSHEAWVAARRAKQVTA